MGFIQDQDLTHISAKQLLGFKEKTFTILQRHQAHLIDISQNFECLSSDDEFPAQLTADDYIAGINAKYRAIYMLD